MALRLLAADKLLFNFDFKKNKELSPHALLNTRFSKTVWEEVVNLVCENEYEECTQFVEKVDNLVQLACILSNKPPRKILKKSASRIVSTCFLKLEPKTQPCYPGLRCLDPSHSVFLYLDPEILMLSAMELKNLLLFHYFLSVVFSKKDFLDFDPSCALISIDFMHLYMSHLSYALELYSGEQFEQRIRKKQQEIKQILNKNGVIY